MVCGGNAPSHILHDRWTLLPDTTLELWERFKVSIMYQLGTSEILFASDILSLDSRVPQ